MLAEKTRAEALRAFMAGRKVIVLDEYDDGSIGAENLEDMLPEDVRYLVNVPACVNPEFEQAVQDMEKPVRRYELPTPELSAGESEYGVAPPSEGPEMNKGLPAGKTKKEICREFKEQGLSMKEISNKTGIPYNTVYYYFTDRQSGYKRAPGRNADRHLCKTCCYRGKNSGCDYCIFTDKDRGCDPADCDKYKKGARLKCKD